MKFKIKNMLKKQSQKQDFDLLAPDLLRLLITLSEEAFAKNSSLQGLGFFTYRRIL